jgi:diguanylate cyclase
LFILNNYLIDFGRNNEVDTTKDKKLWQISNIENDARTTQMTISNKENSIGIDEYYEQIENYTKQIRSTDDLNEIINILDVALIETKNLYFNGEVKNVRGHVHRTGKDIETLKNELEALQNLVHTDQLTGALNRAGFDASLVREASDADRHDNSLCLVSVNIDDFKVFIDIYGNQAGNLALSHLVNVIKESLRPSDIVARFGLEEFVILLPNTTLELATQITNRLQNNLAERSLLDVDRSIPITFSAGIAVRARYEHQNSVIGCADRALHIARIGRKKQISVAN